MPKKYDYIIAGTGLAGLSLAYRIRLNEEHADKHILLLDRDNKSNNDRTWCFWSQADDLFDPILYRSWPSICFANDEFTQHFDIRPYRYKMIRGIDFYKHTLSFLQKQKNTDFVIDPITQITESPEAVTVKTIDESYEAPYIFKSYLDRPNFAGSHFVWQHFKGWVVQTPEPVFDPESAVFMDFRVPQADETRFFYVLPFSNDRALVELAIFSDDIPESSFYDPFLRDYIHTHYCRRNFSIIEEELGAIPMTSYNFNTRSEGGRIIHIGTNGGRVKGSSGYAFTRIQKESERLSQSIDKGQLATYRPVSNRYDFYDRIFLNAILTGKTSGSEVFGSMFRKLDPIDIFKFLDEEGGLLNDLKVFTAPPTLPFFKAFLDEIMA